jgi:GxxExxY protein
MDENTIGTSVVNCALEIHKEIGPGLLESVYEVLLADALAQNGFSVERRQPVPIHFRENASMRVSERILWWRGSFL